MLNLEQLIKLAADNRLIGLFDVEEEAYHAGPGHSQSVLKEFKKSPAHAKTAMDFRRPPTPAMLIGKAFHCATLEPKRFADAYVKAPEIERRSNAGKAAYAAWESENQGKAVIDSDDLELVLRMREAVRAHPVASSLTGSVVEKAAYWIDQATGLLCKCKPDAIVTDQGVILDLKTTSDEATESGFSRSIGNYGYHVQAAFYLDGLKAAVEQSVGLQSVGWSMPTRFVFMAVEKGRPHGVGLFELDSLDLERGREAYRAYLSELAICLAENHWPSYRQGIQKVSLPTWAA